LKDPQRSPAVLFDPVAEIFPEFRMKDCDPFNGPAQDDTYDAAYRPMTVSLNAFQLAAKLSGGAGRS